MLDPPGRPFVCEPAKTAESKDYIICCNDRSFCNDLDVPVGKPESLRNAEKANGKSIWPWFLIIFVVAVVFSGIGLIFGIFYFPSSKRIMRNVLRRYGKEHLLPFAFT